MGCTCSCGALHDKRTNDEPCTAENISTDRTQCIDGIAQEPTTELPAAMPEIVMDNKSCDGTMTKSTEEKLGQHSNSLDNKDSPSVPVESQRDTEANGASTVANDGFAESSQVSPPTGLLEDRNINNRASLDAENEFHAEHKDPEVESGIAIVCAEESSKDFGDALLAKPPEPSVDEQHVDPSFETHEGNADKAVETLDVDDAIELPKQQEEVEASVETNAVGPSDEAHEDHVNTKIASEVISVDHGPETNTTQVSKLAKNGADKDIETASSNSRTGADDDERSVDDEIPSVKVSHKGVDHKRKASLELAVPPRCTGYMLKEGSKFKSWRRRFFVLEAGKLAYFDPVASSGSHDSRHVGTPLFLFGYHVTQPPDNLKRILLVNDNKRGARSLLLETLTDQDKRVWIAAFEAHIMYLNRYAALCQADPAEPNVDTISAPAMESRPSEFHAAFQQANLNSKFNSKNPTRKSGNVSFVRNKRSIPESFSGYMYKEGQHFKTFRNRYFVLENGVLTYSEPGGSTVGSIALSGYSAMDLSVPNKHRILLVKTSLTAGQKNRQLLLEVVDRDDHQLWLEALGRHIEYMDSLESVVPPPVNE